MNGMFENARSFNFGDEVKAAWLNEAAYNDNIFQGSCSADTSCGLCGKTNKKNTPADTAKCNGKSVLPSSSRGTTACTYCLDDSTECCPIKCADSNGAGVPFEQSECSAGSTIKSSLALNCAAANCVSSRLMFISFVLFIFFFHLVLTFFLLFFFSLRIFVADCCDANPCAPTEVANSDRATTGAITGNTEQKVTVTCDAGYSGGGTATCAPNAQFNSLVCTADTCTATEVANSDQSATGAITGTTGQTTTVTCDTGYAGTATFTAKCGTEGTFNTITCAGEPCTPTEVANSDQAAIGAITGTTGSTTTVTCDTNFHGVGAGFPTTTCSSSGTFNTLTCAANPTCIDTDGSATAFVQNDCDAGFTIKGTLPTAPCATGTCQTSECCDINSCASSEVANSDKSTAGSITGDTGSTTTVTCDTGYAGTATFTATCGTEGTFNTITCAGEPCTVSEIANTNKATTGAISGTTADVVTIVCDNGFSGGGDVVCQTSNLFTDLTAVGCIALPCVHTDSPHSDKSHTGSISGKTTDAVTVTCDAGYTGSGISKCGSNGQFNEIVCEAKSCDATEVKNSKFSATGSIHGKFGDHAIQINCLDGFKGSGLAICGTDGKFNTISCTEISTVAAGANAAGASSTIETGGASSATTIAPTVAADAAQKEVASSRSTTATLGTTTGLLAAIIGVLLVLVFLMRRSNQQKQAKLDKKEARLHMAEAKVQVEMTNSNPMLTSQLSKITV